MQGDDHVITLLVTDNPRKPGTGAAIRFALYRTGMTVAEYVAAGGQRSNIATDVGRGSISVAPPKTGGAK